MIEIASLIKDWSSMWMPLRDMDPAEFAERFRRLHEVYCSERPGRWDNAVFPYQPHIMNAVAEGIRTGKRGVVFMKAGQIGGTDCMINAMLWLKVYYPGPQLFMTSTEKTASEFGRERFEPIIRDMEPLSAKYTPNPRGDILTKRFIDGKIQLSGGQSVFNLQSTPYRIVGIDELDSLVDNLGGEGDPVKLAEVRTDSFSGDTLLVAWAHPTTKERGAAKLFFESSDQRRGFVKHSCGHAFFLQWEHVTCAGDTKNPIDYHYVCPQCGAIIDDSERAAMVRKVEYRSTLPPEVAARKSWVGLHASQLYSPAKSIRSLADRWIDCGDDENAKRVFYNKILGEPFEPKVQKIDLSSLQALIVRQRRPNDPEFYSRGQIPAGVRFLTAGQDSRTTELHYTVWGWGLRRGTDKVVQLCGWLIEYGCIKRNYSLTFSESEYHVFDELIYYRVFPSCYGDRTFQVVQCGHDVGYQPTQLPIIRFCRRHPSRGIPVKGASETATSASRSQYARWGTAIKHKSGETETTDETSRALILNTYMLKTDFYGWVGQRMEIPDAVTGTRKVGRLSFPEDVGDEFMKQTASEKLMKGKRTNELVWTKDGPNHYADCNTYALGVALNLDPFQGGKTADEAEGQRQRRPPHIEFEDTQDRETDDVLMG